MPILAGLLANLFGSIAAFFVQFVTKKVAFGLAAVTIFGSLTVALMAGMTTLINTVLTVDALPDAVIFGLWYFMPSAFPAAFTAVVTAYIAAAVYKWNVENVKLMAFVS